MPNAALYITEPSRVDIRIGPDGVSSCAVGRTAALATFRCPPHAGAVEYFVACSLPIRSLFAVTRGIAREEEAVSAGSGRLRERDVDGRLVEPVRRVHILHYQDLAVEGC